MTTNFDFSFLISCKFELNSPKFNKTKLEIQLREVVPSFLKKAKSKLEIFFSKSDFNFHVHFSNLGWRGTVTKY